jgi:hypothetical protein
MKCKKLSLLFLVSMMILLTSSIETPGNNNTKPGCTYKDSCLVSGKGSYSKKSVNQTPVVQKKYENSKEVPFADYKLPITPFSRFIL